MQIDPRNAVTGKHGISNAVNLSPVIKISGSAFNGNTTQAHRPIGEINGQSKLKIVSLSRWCENNFISRDTGYKLIKLKYLIAFRRHHIWWVRANPTVIDCLKEYLGVDELAFDPE